MINEIYLKIINSLKFLLFYRYANFIYLSPIFINLFIPVYYYINLFLIKNDTIWHWKAFETQYDSLLTWIVVKLKLF